MVSIGQSSSLNGKHKSTKYFSILSSPHMRTVYDGIKNYHLPNNGFNSELVFMGLHKVAKRLLTYNTRYTDDD